MRMSLLPAGRGSTMRCSVLRCLAPAPAAPGQKRSCKNKFASGEHPLRKLFPPADKKVLNFPFLSAIIPAQPQDSYIGNTTASQAVKAGSTPVSCSKHKGTLRGAFYVWRRKGSRTYLNAARRSAAGEGLTEPLLTLRRAERQSTPVSCSKKLPDPHGFGSFFCHTIKLRFLSG